MNCKINIDGDISIINNKYGFPLVVQGFHIDNNIIYETQLLESILGYNLEITLPLHPSEVERLLPEIIYNSIEKDIIITDGLQTSELTGAPVEFKIGKPKIELKDTKVVARILFSDENLILPSEENCHPIYKKQLN